VPLQNDLAMSVYMRALAKRSLPDKAGASADVAVGLEIQQRLVAALGARCPPSYRQLLDALGRLRSELSAKPGRPGFLQAIRKLTTNK